MENFTSFAFIVVLITHKCLLM